MLEHGSNRAALEALSAEFPVDLLVQAGAWVTANPKGEGRDPYRGEEWTR